jgi:2-isopropylmalate synthase
MARNGAPILSNEELIYDWNEHEPQPVLDGPRISFCDETLRDGLQNPSVKDPTLQDKIALLHKMDAIGIDVADVGLPGASRRSYEHTLGLCQEIAAGRLGLRPMAAGRTLVEDVRPIVDISQRAGLPIEAYLFIGSSPIRQLTEDWDMAHMTKLCADAIDAAVKGGLPAAFVLEDATRTRPEALQAMIRVAVDHGVGRVCLADTVGHATTQGVRSLINFTRRVLQEAGAGGMGIDWHGHNDRGLALSTTLLAMRCGADRLHGSALGIGERVGNAPMELILVNLKLAGLLEDQDLRGIIDYCALAASIVGWTVPFNYPVIGRDAFRTATGVHASIILKAEVKGDQWLADRVYSSVPAGMFGRHQEIVIGYMSGASNVAYWLRRRGIAASPGLIAEILKAAKASDCILSDEQVMQIVRRQ